MSDLSQEHRLSYSPRGVLSRRAVVVRLAIVVGVLAALICAGRIGWSLVSERWPPLTATAPSTGEVDLTWKPLAGVQQYQVYRSTNPKFTPDYASLYSNNVASNSYVDNQVVGGTTYYYKVAGVKNDATVVHAGAGSITTPAKDEPLIGISTRP